MQYFGGKQRISSQIVKYLQSIRNNRIYLEPFVGAGNIVCKMDGTKKCSDNHEDLILLLLALQQKTITLPDFISLDEYKKLQHSSSSALRGFVGFGCSYSGKWFGGYARNKEGRNYCLNAKNSITKKDFSGIEICLKDYKEWNVDNHLIYCDPPYKGTTKIHSKIFNSDEFWEVMKKWSKDNTVIISEYEAPSDFECVKEITTKTDIRGKDKKSFPRIEKLFKLRQDCLHFS